MRKKILLRGPVLSRSGYGEQSRFALRSLRKHEDRFDVYLINTKWGGTGYAPEENEERQYIDFLLQKTYHYIHTSGGNPEFDMSLQVTIPNEWEKLAPVNVGYTAGIETNKIAPQWIEKCMLMDRIIVTSTHSKETMLNTVYDIHNPEDEKVVGRISVKGVPVEAVGYPVKLTKKKSVKLDLETDFNFLAVSQWGPRKNTGNTVKWFIEKFKDNPNVGLILKGFIRNNSTTDKIHTRHVLGNLVDKDVKCKIYLLHGDLSDEEMIGLYSHPKVKCLVSLSHGEGWGLPLFEASYSGLPIITTNWSGQCDFLNVSSKQRKKGAKKKTETVLKPMFCEVDYTLGPIPESAVWDGVLQADSMWCYPDENSYKKALLNVYKDYEKHQDAAKKLKAWVKKEFEAEKQYSAFANAVLPYDEKQETHVVSFD